MYDLVRRHLVIDYVHLLIEIIGNLLVIGVLLEAEFFSDYRAVDKKLRTNINLSSVVRCAPDERLAYTLE